MRLLGDASKGPRLVFPIVLLAACAATHEPAVLDAGIDGSVVDGALDDSAASDASLLDACAHEGEERFYEHGYCFRIPRCCTDVDCADDHVCNERGRCVSRAPSCSCASSSDCPDHHLCFTNDVVCGACMPERPSCESDPCPDGLECIEGDCADPAACLAEL